MIKLSGLTPAVFTPFDKTGAINLAQIQPYADKLVTMVPTAFSSAARQANALQ